MVHGKKLKKIGKKRNWKVTSLGRDEFWSRRLIAIIWKTNLTILHPKKQRDRIGTNKNSIGPGKYLSFSICLEQSDCGRWCANHGPFCRRRYKAGNHKFERYLKHKLKFCVFYEMCLELEACGFVLMLLDTEQCFSCVAELER